MAAAASSGLAISTNANPLDCPVSLSETILTSVTVRPFCPNRVLRSMSLVL
jgi:hypothetical protein